MPRRKLRRIQTRSSTPRTNVTSDVRLSVASTKTAVRASVTTTWVSDLTAARVGISRTTNRAAAFSWKRYPVNNEWKIPHLSDRHGSCDAGWVNPYDKAAMTARSSKAAKYLTVRMVGG